MRGCLRFRKAVVPNIFLVEVVTGMLSTILTPILTLRVEKMEEQSASKEVDPRLVALIVRSYVAHNRVGVDQLSGLISEVHRSLGGLGREAPLQGALVPAVSIKRSVHRDYVVCIECGFR